MTGPTGNSEFCFPRTSMLLLALWFPWSDHSLIKCLKSFTGTCTCTWVKSPSNGMGDLYNVHASVDAFCMGLRSTSGLPNLDAQVCMGAWSWYATAWSMGWVGSQWSGYTCSCLLVSQALAWKVNIHLYPNQGNGASNMSRCQLYAYMYMRTILQIILGCSRNEFAEWLLKPVA